MCLFYSFFSDVKFLGYRNILSYLITIYLKPHLSAKIMLVIQKKKQKAQKNQCSSWYDTTRQRSQASINRGCR